MKHIRSAAVVLAAAVALTACGSSTDSSNEAATAGGKTKIRLWLVGTDTPQAARDYAKATFEKENPKAELVIEQQVWDGLVDKLTTSLSGSDSPDVVEVGNTQAVAFTSAGAFKDISDKKAELGGDDLLSGFVDAGSYDGKLFAAPYYAGSRLVFYRKDLVKTVPTTLNDYVAEGAKLKKESKKNPFSGIYFPGQDWRNALPYIWSAGGDLAVEKDGKWQGSLSTPQSVAGLKQVQQVMQNASGAAKDGNETDPQVPFCANQIGMLSAPGWVKGSILDPKAGCPKMESKLGVFALPGASAGQTAPVFLGGSNIAIAAKSKHQDLAYGLMKVLLSDGYQTEMAKAGLIPAKKSLFSALGTDDVAKAIGQAASNTKSTPAAPGWANVESDKILEDLFVQIAKGGDVQSLATAADAKITAALNR
ncbi:extracellular solute-binding protein [Angustibacter sp. McL0619]|uniref:extracellular solute-binding protein n=1 Tax=Angustibacter sp. McL0619 TaxID=3415676 RepID=UPI003CF8F228